MAFAPGARCGDLDPNQVRAAVAAWCSTTVEELDAQLVPGGSARHAVVREIDAALARGDPTRVHEARFMASRDGISR